MGRQGGTKELFQIGGKPTLTQSHSENPPSVNRLCLSIPGVCNTGRQYGCCKDEVYLKLKVEMLGFLDCVDSDSDSDLWRYEEGSYEGEVNEAKNPEGQVGELLMSLKVSKLPPLLYLKLNVYALSLVSAYFLPKNFHLCVLSFPSFIISVLSGHL